MSKPPPPTFEQLRAMTGEEVGVSDWIVVDQDRIDRFADCTEDRQWLHVDSQRARRESPFRDTIAHGYLSLSLIGGLCQQMNVVPENTQAVFNYGLDLVRFLAPVRAGARVRLRARLVSVEDRGPAQYLMKFANEIEIEGSERPALVAETLAMFYERRRKKTN